MTEVFRNVTSALRSSLAVSPVSSSWLPGAPSESVAWRPWKASRPPIAFQPAGSSSQALKPNPAGPALASIGAGLLASAVGYGLGTHA